MKVLLPKFKPVLFRGVSPDRGQGASTRDLITVVAQDAETREVLMVAYTDRAGYFETLRTKRAVYYSTSRHERWCKGETSGDFQSVTEVLIDCDGDAVIYLVKQEGAGACHTGARSCFFRRIDGASIMEIPNPLGEKELLDMIPI